MRSCSFALILIALGFNLIAFAAPNSLAEVAQEYAQLRKNQSDLIPEIDGQRLVEANTWELAYETTNKPWLIYGKNTFRAWLNGAKWINENADGLNFDVDLYDRLEKIVLHGHYYKGFEVRRIQAAMESGQLSEKNGEALLLRIERGEAINFSKVDHSTLPGQFRTDPLDEFKHNGDLFLKDGTRYLTQGEIDNARNNFLLKVDETSLVKIGPNKFKGTIKYPRIKNLKKLVQQSFDQINRKLAEQKSLEEKVWDILNFRTELLTIHRSLDGNGRTIRLLADLLFLRIGLPPPATPIENDIFGDPRETYEATLKDMHRYVKTLRYFRHKPKIPSVLFHWTTKESFEWMTHQRQNFNSPPMQTIDKNSLLATQFRNLSDKQGTFTWINPLKATRGGQDKTGIEWYVKPNRTPVLVGYFMDKNARVLHLRTVDKADIESEKKIDNVDVIYHQHLEKNGLLLFHEWVILNPTVIRRWTSDPEELRPFIEKERIQIRKLGKSYSELNEHYLDAETKYSKHISSVMIDKFFSAVPMGLSCQKLFN